MTNEIIGIYAPGDNSGMKLFTTGEPLHIGFYKRQDEDGDYSLVKTGRIVWDDETDTDIDPSPV